MVTPLERIRERPEPRASWMPMVVVAMAQVLMVFNVTAMKVSIDGIATSLRAPPTTVKTAIVTHLLVIAGLIMLGARIHQRFGWRRLFPAMLALYAAAMLVMVLGRGSLTLMIAQIVAGAAAAALVPTLAGLIVDSYRGEQQARALGWLGAVQAMSIVPAFLIAGALATWVGWRVTFGLLALLAAISCKLSANLTTAERSAVGTGSIDKVGVVLALLAIFLIGLGFNNLAAWGMLRASPAAPFSLLSISPAPIVIVGGVFLIRAFLAWERKCSAGGQAPLVAPDLMDTPRERSALIAILATGAISSAITFLIPLYIEVVQGRTSLYTAVALLPYTGATFAAAILVVPLRGLLGSRRLVRYALLAVAIGVALLGVTIRNDWSNSMVVLSMLVAGFGEGALLTLLFKVLVITAPRKLAGDVDSLCGCTGYLGAGVGIGLAGALVIGVLSASIHRDLVQNPLIPDELKAQVNLDNVSFVSNDQLQTTLAGTTATPEQVAEAVRINTEARLRALKVSFFVLAGLALLMVFPATRVPDDTVMGPKSN